MLQPARNGGVSTVGLSIEKERDPAAPTPAEELDHLPSAASRQLASEIAEAAPTPMLCCFVGPSGTGKTGLSERVHALSSRRDAPLVHLDLASVPGPLTTSAIFGHVRGAFTDARERRAGALVSAHRGTLVLDEITKASIEAQHALLRVLDHATFQPTGSDREVRVDVRLVALTSEPLSLAVKSGRLIADLRFRLKEFVFSIPPLSERIEDVAAVVSVALRRHAPFFGYDRPPNFSEAALRDIVGRPLHGNHRQVDGIVQRALARARGARFIEALHLPAPDKDEICTESPRDRFLRDFAEGLPSAHGPVGSGARYYNVDRSTFRRWRDNTTSQMTALAGRRPGGASARHL